MSFEINPIGHIKTPYTELARCPNNVHPDGPSCEIILNETYHQGLLGLEEGQYILILYWFEGVDRTLVTQEVANNQQKGTFALRSPHRPNPVVAAVLPIEKIEVGKITVKGLDCLSGTPLIDIKPSIYTEA